MTSNTRKAQFKSNILALVFLINVLNAFLLPQQAYALDEQHTYISLPAFIASVKNGDAETLRGIYVAGVMAFPIVQQPTNNPGYVSSMADTVTQFGMPSEAGNLGLLAHNNLSGLHFFQLMPGDTITLVYGDGHTVNFIVDQILQYQTLEPQSIYSDFKDLETGAILDVQQLFAHVYQGDFHLTLQTCIENEGDPSWGRLFIMAKPVGESQLNKFHYILRET